MTEYRDRGPFPTDLNPPHPLTGPDDPRICMFDLTGQVTALHNRCHGEHIRHVAIEEAARAVVEFAHAVDMSGLGDAIDGLVAALAGEAPEVPIPAGDAS